MIISGMALSVKLKARRLSRATLDLVDIEVKVESVDYGKCEVLLRGPKVNNLSIPITDASHLDELSIVEVVILT
jgi:hypothetical protein